jgi:hypothetical protein
VPAGGVGHGDFKEAVAVVAGVSIHSDDLTIVVDLRSKGAIVRGRVQFTNSDRLFFIQLYRWFPSVLKAMMIIRPETFVRWHRAGFRRYWRWKSREAGRRSLQICGR